MGAFKCALKLVLARIHGWTLPKCQTCFCSAKGCPPSAEADHDRVKRFPWQFSPSPDRLSSKKWLTAVAHLLGLRKTKGP